MTVKCFLRRVEAQTYPIGSFPWKSADMLLQVVTPSHHRKNRFAFLRKFLRIAFMHGFPAAQTNWLTAFSKLAASFLCAVLEDWQLARDWPVGQFRSPLTRDQMASEVPFGGVAGVVNGHFMDVETASTVQDCCVFGIHSHAQLYIIYFPVTVRHLWTICWVPQLWMLRVTGLQLWLALKLALLAPATPSGIW